MSLNKYQIFKHNQLIMKQSLSLMVFLFLFCLAQGQSAKNDVLTLGTFHFAFHNRDVIKTEKKDQIDVLEQ